jgi:hypothetical protein
MLLWSGAPDRVGAVTATLDDLTLSSTATNATLDYDLYLGGETRFEAFPPQQRQWRTRHLSWHLTTTYDYPAEMGIVIATLDDLTLTAFASHNALGTLTATLDPLTLASTASSVPGPSGDLTALLDDLVLSSLSGPEETGDVTVILDDLTLTCLASETPVVIASMVITLDDLILESADAESHIEASLVVTLDGVTLEANELAIQAFGNAAIVLDDLMLSSDVTLALPPYGSMEALLDELTLESRAMLRWLFVTRIDMSSEPYGVIDISTTDHVIVFVNEDEEVDPT